MILAVAMSHRRHFDAAGGARADGAYLRRRRLTIAVDTTYLEERRFRSL